MKIKSLTMIAILGISLLFLNACTKEAIENALGKMTCKVDGTAWSVSSASLTGGVGGVVGVVVSEKLTITGSNTDGKTIVIFINGLTPNVDYDLKALEGQANAGTVYRNNPNDAEANTYFSTNGTVRITSITENRVSGTFSFTAAKSATETVTITEGKFENVYYK